MLLLFFISRTVKVQNYHYTLDVWHRINTIWFKVLAHSTNYLFTLWHRFKRKFGQLLCQNCESIASPKLGFVRRWFFS